MTPGSLVWWVYTSVSRHLMKDKLMKVWYVKWHILNIDIFEILEYPHVLASLQSWMHILYKFDLNFVIPKLFHLSDLLIEISMRLSVGNYETLLILQIIVKSSAAAILAFPIRIVYWGAGQICCNVAFFVAFFAFFQFASQ